MFTFLIEFIIMFLSRSRFWDFTFLRVHSIFNKLSIKLSIHLNLYLTCDWSYKMKYYNSNINLGKSTYLKYWIGKNFHINFIFKQYVLLSNWIGPLTCLCSFKFLVKFLVKIQNFNKNPKKHFILYFKYSLH